MKKYSIVNRLLSEAVVYEDQSGHGAAPVTLKATPVNSLDQIFAHDKDWDLRKWHTMDRSFYRHWEDISGDPRHWLYHSIELFFHNNPKAAQSVKDNLSSTAVKRGKIIKSAIPIFYDNDIGGEPWGYMYNGQISPAGRLKASQRFVKKLQSGGDAEKEFADHLKSIGYANVQVIGGARNPDVLADNVKFECGTGLNKTLWLGKQNLRGYWELSDGVAARRKVLDKFLSTQSLMTHRRLISRGVFAIWKSTGYDFLIKGEQGSFEAYSLSDKPSFIAGQQIKNLTENLCNDFVVLAKDGGYMLQYKSIDWSEATKLV